MKVVIDPGCRISYASFYIMGLYSVFGKKSVSFSNQYFTGLNKKADGNWYDHYMAMALLDGERSYKIIIDYRDSTSIKQQAYRWCDVYAKVNFNRNEIPAQYLEKIIPITPGFGTRIWNRRQTYGYAIRNLVRSNTGRIVSIKLFLSNYLGTLQRPNIEDYFPIEGSDANYIFFISTLWTHDNCIASTNKWRYAFISRIRSMKDVVFEGGLSATTENAEYLKYRDAIIDRNYPTEEYVLKTKRSAVAFNTPSVANCHGWKLGEFLAMGKAIVSTPLYNELPESLVHGRSIHFVNDESELEKAMEEICNNHNYRKQLEEGAREYFCRLASPQAVINRIIQFVGINANEK